MPLLQHLYNTELGQLRVFAWDNETERRPIMGETHQVVLVGQLL